VLGLIAGGLLLLHAQCINPTQQLELCETPTLTATPTDTPTPTLEPTATPEPDATETPTPTPTDTPTAEPTETPTPRPTPQPTGTPVPRDTPTPRPTPLIERRVPPTLRPGPERAKSAECLAAPPAVPDVPGVRERDWTSQERCGGTPEAQATRYALDRPTLVPVQPPEEVTAREVVVVPVIILPVLVVVVTETPVQTPEATPVTLVERVLAPPVQLPEGE
jgi:type VI secretion system secreted protein VgrG